MNRKTLVLSACAVAAVIAAACALAFGSAKLSLGDVVGGLFRTSENPTNIAIIHATRLPRCLAALLAGAGLGISGALLQSATGNALAGPNIIGVNAGAGFFMVLVSCVMPLGYALTPFAAMAGAFLCAALIAAISARAGGQRVTIVLAGVAVSALFSAGISMLRLIYPDSAITYTYFSIGGLGGVTGVDELIVPCAIIAVCFVAAMCVARRLNLLSLGDDAAASLGVRVRPLRIAALLLSSASAAAAVSFAGLLGFVGLMSPHIARRLLSSEDARVVMPTAALIGAALTSLADTVGRVAFAPSQVPAGVFLAILGVPFFLVLLVGKRGRV